MVAEPDPMTAAAAARLKAADWNRDVRDMTLWTVANIGGFGPRNAIVNPFFDVWQAGSSLAIPNSATPAYLADQWCARRNGASGATMSRITGLAGQQYVARFARDSATSATTPIEVFQALESAECFRFQGSDVVQVRVRARCGTGYTASGRLLNVKLVSGTGTDQAPASTWTGETVLLDEDLALLTDVQEFVFDDVVVPDSCTQLKVVFTFTPVGTAGTNDWFELCSVQLTDGPCAGWERLPVAVERERCYRHFIQFGPYGAPVAIGAIVANGATGGSGLLPLPTSMRIVPTVTVSAANDFGVSGVTITTLTITGCATRNALFVAAGWASGTAVGIQYDFNNTPDTANAYIRADARL